MDLRLPALGEGADSGTVVNFFVKEGDVLAKDQPVLELENEKAIATIPSTAAGTVGKILVKVGDKISVGQRILVFAEGGGVAPASAPATPRRAAAPVEVEPAPEPVEESSPAPEPAEPAGAQESKVPPAAAPSIRKLARDLGLDLTRVRGSARGGRIILEDVRAYIQKLQRQAAAPKLAGAPAATPARPVAPSVDFSKWGPVTKQPLSALRQVIARRMTESWTTVPQVTQFDEADLTAANALRQKYAAAYQQKGTRLTLTPFVLKALVETLKKHPVFNSSLDETAQQVVLKNYFHIGIAVDTEAGLLVPVVRDVDKKSLLELSKELEDLAKRARERKINGDEMKGGTFTVSNQGAIGGSFFTPIVNCPEVAILGLGRGALKPVVRGGQLEPRLLMPIGLSYDHRVIDGGTAARFTVDLVKAFETFSEQDVKL